MVVSVSDSDISSYFRDSAVPGWETYHLVRMTWTSTYSESTTAASAYSEFYINFADPC